MSELTGPDGPTGDQHRRSALSGLRAHTWPDHLVGRPCPLPPAAWHQQQLAALGDAAGSASPARQARLLYHQRLLAYLADPRQDTQRPLVTILIPTYNRSGLLADAVRSCLDQSWRPIEILVIDDGSEEDIAGGLGALAGEIRLYRKAHGGVSSARNLGIKLARGDFIHLLDSDDLLLPDAVARKVAAFAAIPDAALCYSMANEQNLPHVPVPKIRVPDGSEHCATSDLLPAALGRCPFFVPTVMMPRWTMLEFPGFEEDLRRGEDTRYWVRLGLAGAKAIGFTEPLIVRRVTGQGLSTVRNVGSLAVDIKLRNLRDILATPPAWHHAGFVVRQIAHKLNELPPSGPMAGPLAGLAALERVTTTIAGLGDGQPRAGLSPLPLLIDMRSALESVTVEPQWTALWRDLARTVSSALPSAAPLSQEDFAHWGDPATAGRRRTSIARLFRCVLELGSKDRGLPKRIDHVLRAAPQVPSARSVRRYRRLRRRLRLAPLAAWLTWPAAYRPRFR